MTNYTREILISDIEHGLKYSSRPDGKYCFCGDGVRAVLDLLKRPQTEQKKGTINLPEPTDEMLQALHSQDVRSGGIRIVCLERYNRLKEILARPTTKTVTKHLVMWTNGKDAYSTVCDTRDLAHRMAEQRRIDGRRNISILEIQQTVDDTTN